MAADKAYQNAKQNSDKQNARIEHDKALARVMTAVLKDDTELFKQFMDNELQAVADRYRVWHHLRATVSLNSDHTETAPLDASAGILVLRQGGEVVDDTGAGSR